MFKYCSYWNTWDRILQREDGLTCELNLTPVNGFNGGDMNTVRLEVVRIHGTSPGERDKNFDELPSEVRKEMEKHLGAELVERLLTHDYMSELYRITNTNNLYSLSTITYSLSNGGGIPLESVRTCKYHYWK